ncbi:MAG: helix-turn-helix transcriptional regulator [Ruminococcaceae bacterium]|nr:helix-turn-helix transcriptional regulator [Oscillospiraceae bacterium]
MYTEFTRERITKLRMEKGVSEYKMSYDLGHSRSYINNISSGKALPSMQEFFAICEYFDITPTEFFNVDVANPAVFSETAECIQKLSEKDMVLVLELIRRLASGN